MRTYEYPKLGLENLVLVERPLPQPAANEVVVKFHAASLNYRELLFAWGLYNPNPRLPAVPGSDGAGEVTAVGDGVTRWKIGDRVCPIFIITLSQTLWSSHAASLNARQQRTNC